jgi:hypothetical protein
MSRMPDPPRELLVVASRGADAAAAVTHAGGRVVQRLDDRIALVTIDADGRRGLADDPTVVGVFDDDVPAGVRDELDDGERLFVDAWRERARTKQRTGEGASWDAPGFEAP